MTLSSVAGVFSRYFIVGFFLPAFFAIVAVSQTVHSALLPHVYLHAAPGAQIAIIGGVALAAGLLLLGVHYHVLRAYEGYPLVEHSTVIGIKQLHGLLMSWQRRRFRHALEDCDFSKDDHGHYVHLDERRPFDAAWQLDRRFPHDLQQPEDTGLLLPTAFGNTVRAFERHPFLRWHLNGIGAWPYVESLLSDQEAQVLADAKGDVAFFINTSLLSIAVTVVLAADRIAHESAASALVALIPLAISALSYGASIGAARRWGEVVRASIDLHRRELYDKLGLRTPLSFSDERSIAWNLNRTLLAGLHLPNDLGAPAGDAGAGPAQPEPQAVEPAAPAAPPAGHPSPAPTGFVAMLIQRSIRRF